MDTLLYMVQMHRYPVAREERNSAPLSESFTRIDHLHLYNKLTWLLMHRTQLARRDQYLLHFAQPDISNMPVKTKRGPHRLLGMAHAIHQQELPLHENGQSVITDFFPTNPRA